jgi:hypothetical protein
MKQLILLLFIVGGLGIPTFSQTLTADKVPAPVLIAFKMHFPKADRTRWELQPDSTYGVFFSLGKWRHFARCDEQGQWLQHNDNISFDQLPDVIKQATTQQFTGFEPRYIQRIDTLHRELAYEVFLIRDKEFYIVRYSPRGEVLKNEGKKVFE